jgi:general secretion pathway protein D
LGSVDLVTSKREIKTNVLVRDGNLVVLGGLIDESETEGVSKVPGLGDIPGVGGLFSYKDNKIARRNLMVFLRPRILRDDQLATSHASAKYKGLTHQMNELAERKETKNGEISSPSLPDDVNNLLILPPEFDASSTKRATPAPVVDLSPNKLESATTP